MGVCEASFMALQTGNYKVRNGYDVTIPNRWSIGFYDAERKSWFQDRDHNVPLKVVAVGRKARFFKFILECIGGGGGWGETGQRAMMCAEGETLEESEKFVKKHIPGGWKANPVGETTETYYLRHL